MNWDPPADPSEIVLEEILSSTLLRDFVLRSPSHLDKGLRKEVCDHVLEQKNDAVLIQLKTRKRHHDSVERSRSWTRKAAAKAVKQLIGAARTFGTDEVTYNHMRRGSGTIPPNTLRTRHGIAIVDNPSGEQIALDCPTQVGTMSIHVLTPGDFINLCRELGTLADLLYYLDRRCQIPTAVQGMIAIERAVCAWHLGRGGELGTITNLAEAEQLARDLFEGKSHGHYRVRRSEDRFVRIYDRIVDQVHWVDADRSIRMEPGMNDPIRGREALDPSDYIHVAYELNEIRRASRVAIGKRLQSKCELATHTTRPHFFATLNDRRDCCLVFAACSIRDDEGRNSIANLTRAALCRVKHRMPELRRAVGALVGSDNREDPGIDYCLVEIDGNVTADDLEFCRQVFGDLEEFTVADLTSTLDPPTIYSAVHFEEWPRPESIHRGRIGRNDPCPCGSGRKFKRCHG